MCWSERSTRTWVSSTAPLLAILLLGCSTERVAVAYKTPEYVFALEFQRIGVQGRVEHVEVRLFPPVSIPGGGLGIVTIRCEGTPPRQVTLFAGSRQALLSAELTPTRELVVHSLTGRLVYGFTDSGEIVLLEVHDLDDDAVGRETKPAAWSSCSPMLSLPLPRLRQALSSNHTDRIQTLAALFWLGHGREDECVSLAHHCRSELEALAADTSHLRLALAARLALSRATGVR